jgi:hypothetical protein
LDAATVWVAADLGLRVAEHGDDAIEVDFTAELLEAFSTSAVGERLSGFESTTGQTPGPIVAAPPQEDPTLVVHDGDANGRHRLRLVSILMVDMPNLLWRQQGDPSLPQITGVGKAFGRSTTPVPALVTSFSVA